MSKYVVGSTRKNIVEFVNSQVGNGYGAVMPVIDGEEYPELTIGYASEEDMKAGMKFLEEALQACGGVKNVHPFLHQALNIMARDLKPDEMVEIDGCKYIFSYQEAKAYIPFGEPMEIASAPEMIGESDKVIKAILIEKVKNWCLTARKNRDLEEAIDFDGDDDDECCEGLCENCPCADDCGMNPDDCGQNM